MTDHIAQFEAERMAELPYDSSDAQQVNNARKAAALRESEELETLKALSLHENGRGLLFDFVKCYLVGNPAVIGDPNSTYYNLGQEHKARELFKKIVRIAPEEFCKMIEENKDEL